MLPPNNRLNSAFNLRNTAQIANLPIRINHIQVAKHSDLQRNMKQHMKFIIHEPAIRQSVFRTIEYSLKHKPAFTNAIKRHTQTP